MDNSHPNTFNNNGQYIETSKNGNTIYYSIQNKRIVRTEKELIDALQKSNTSISLANDITLTQNIEIYKDDNNKVISSIEIFGNGFYIDCNDTYKITFKTNGTKINGVKFKNYLNTALSLYGASNVELNDIILEGKDTSLENANRSKIGMDITRSTVTINNLISKNHIYRGIQVKQNSNLTLNGVKHINDSIHLQSISNANGTPVINIKNNEYKEIKESISINGDNIKDYFTKEEISIKSAKDLIDNAKNTGTILVLNNDIVFPSNLDEILKALDPHPDAQHENSTSIEGVLNLSILKNIVIKGSGKTIDLNNICSLLLKGDDSTIENARIINSPSNGIDVYNSKGIKLNKVIVENSKKAGIFANGSIVNVTDCTTINNKESGVISTRSRSLDNPDNPTAYRDSEINIMGTFEQQEPNKSLIIRNLEMVKSNHKQYNTVNFLSSDISNMYNIIKRPEIKSKLNLANQMIFKDWFINNNISFDTEFGTTDTDFIKKQTRIDVTKSNGSNVVLDNTGKLDNTENFKILLKYATLNSNELYFPEGTYKISDNIDLTQLSTAAFSNVKITGADNGLSILDATSVPDKMVIIKNNDYHSQMRYVNINNMVFNNVALEFNGVYKSDISLNDNIFMNGKYTMTDGKATMIPYVTTNNSTYIIERNIFLRGKDFPGKGISTYATKDTIIRDNFFGKLEGMDDASTMLPNRVISKLNLINKTRDLSVEQGNFFTCINNERYDKNITIKNNYINMNDSREIEGVPKNALISGIDAAKEGQRKDHIIYSKSYDGLNIVGNYFKGMANDASGGIKIRNGIGAYVGSNHFKDVPLLTYIYADLTKEENKLHDTTIYNNMFHQTKNIGEEGTGILYYQSFRNGETITFPNKETVDNLQGDIRNFVTYNNKFLSSTDSVITISNRAVNFKDQFYMNGNIYAVNGQSVNYNKGNMSIQDSSIDIVESKLNSGYFTYKNVDMPLYPAKTDSSQLQQEIANFKAYLESAKDKIEKLSTITLNQIKSLLHDSKQLLEDINATQYDINNKVIELKKFLISLKDNINIDDDIMLEPGDNINTDDNIMPKPEDNINTDNDIIPKPEDNINTDNDIVKPNIDTNSNNISSNSTNNNNSSNNILDNNNISNNNTNNDNPKTGDIEIYKYIGLGLASILVIFKNRRKIK